MNQKVSNGEHKTVTKDQGSCFQPPCFFKQSVRMANFCFFVLLSNIIPQSQPPLCVGITRMFTQCSKPESLALHSTIRNAWVQWQHDFLLSSHRSPIPLLFCKLSHGSTHWLLHTALLGAFCSPPHTLPSASCSDHTGAFGLSLAPMESHPVSNFKEDGGAGTGWTLPEVILFMKHRA